MNIRMQEEMVTFVCEIEVAEFVDCRDYPADPQVTPHVMTHDFLPLLLPTCRNPAVTEEVEPTILVDDIKLVEFVAFNCLSHALSASEVIESKVGQLKEILR